MGVDNPETRAREFVDIVDGTAVELPAAFRIDGHHGAVLFGHFVTRHESSETHGILQAGASPFFHSESQPWGAFFRGKFPELICRRLCDMDHEISLYD